MGHCFSSCPISQDSQLAGKVRPSAWPVQAPAFIGTCLHGTHATRSACPEGQSSTRLLNPPQNMRLPSKGMLLGSMMLFMRGSSITLALTLSRCSREEYRIQEKTTVSSSLSCTLCGNDVTLPGCTSSPTHSQYWRAPWSIHILPASSATRRYASRLLIGTGETNPST